MGAPQSPCGRSAEGGHGDLTTRLFVIKADGSGGGSGLELVRANRWVNNQVTAGQFENNQPTWAPPGDLHWVAFNSLRPYGVAFPNGGTLQPDVWSCLLRSLGLRTALIDLPQAAARAVLGLERGLSSPARRTRDPY